MYVCDVAGGLYRRLDILNLLKGFLNSFCAHQLVYRKKIVIHAFANAIDLEFDEKKKEFRNRIAIGLIWDVRNKLLWQNTFFLQNRSHYNTKWFFCVFLWNQQLELNSICNNNHCNNSCFFSFSNIIATIVFI